MCPDDFLNIQAEAGEETTSSQGEWEDYNDTLNEVLTWLEQAEKKLKAQSQISNDVDVVKDQFHEHEVFYCLLSALSYALLFCTLNTIQLPY